MSNEVKTHTFRGKRWYIEPVDNLPAGDLGGCEYGIPGLCHPTLAIPSEGGEEIDLDVIIHESLHACTELDEEAITETATCIARLLWRLGWRNDV